MNEQSNMNQNSSFSVMVGIPPTHVGEKPWSPKHYPNSCYIMRATSGGSDGKESACYVGDAGSIPESGKSPGEEHGNTLQYSCLENPTGRFSKMSWVKEQENIRDVCFHPNNLVDTQFLLAGDLICSLNI